MTQPCNNDIHEGSLGACLASKMADVHCVDKLDNDSVCKQDESAGTMNEMETSQKEVDDVTKEEGVSKLSPFGQADDGSDSPLLSEEDREDDDLVLFDLQRPLESDREGR